MADTEIVPNKFEKSEYVFTIGKSQLKNIDRSSLQELSDADGRPVVAFKRRSTGPSPQTVEPISFKETDKVSCRANFLHLPIPRGMYRVTNLLGEKPTYWPNANTQGTELVAEGGVSTLRVVANISEVKPGNDVGFAPAAAPPFSDRIDKAAACIGGRPCRFVFMADIYRKEYVAFAFHYDPFYTEALVKFAATHGEKTGFTLPTDRSPIYLVPTMVTNVGRDSLRTVYTPCVSRKDREALHNLIISSDNNFHGSSWDTIEQPVPGLPFTLDPLIGLESCPT